MAIEFGILGGAEPPARLWSLPTALAHLEDFVADKAGEIGKSARLTISCPNLLVPPPVIDALVPAVVQLLRNAIEHGLESTMARLAAGKPLTGTIALMVSADRQMLTVRVADDGAGIEAEAVVEAAISAGAIGEDDDEAAAGDVFALLFHRGVTLAETDSLRRGRGLSRAVARLKEIKGKVAIGSEPGAGTTATVTVPLGRAGQMVVPGIDVDALTGGDD